jgi:hypothetical protein
MIRTDSRLPARRRAAAPDTGGRFRRNFVMTLVVLGGIAWALSTTPAGAQTYKLNIWPYCEPNSYCGVEYSSEEELRAALYEAVEEMNLQWKVVGISFEPHIQPIDDTSEQYYSTTACHDKQKYCDDLKTVCKTSATCAPNNECKQRKVCDDLVTECTSADDCASGEQCRDINKQRRWNWRKNVADQQSDAINIMLTEEGNWCCSGIPDPGSDGFNGIYCSVPDAPEAARSVGSVYGHEMGHHYCLSHTFSKQDPATHDPVDHDLDDAHGVTDTPADPCRLEPGTEEHQDETPEGDIRQDHEYCDWIKYTNVSDGSPHDTYCFARCRRCDVESCDPGSDEGFTTLSYSPYEHATMSYFGRECIGPVVVNGVTRQAFSPGSISRIRDCEATVGKHIALQDVCAASGDFDHDGICGLDDNCASHRNTAQVDTDGDGDGDACDLCPKDPTPTVDTDDDGLGDACDPDIDDDGCINLFDQHPNEDQIAVGSVTYVGCSISGETTYAFEGNDTDGNGTPDCADFDDEGDGICDEGGPYGPNPRRGIPDGCEAGEGSPPRDTCPHDEGLTGCEEVKPGGPCPPAFHLCSLGCQEYYLKIADLINPADTIRVDTFSIIGDTVYMRPPAGMTAAELAASAIGPGAAGGAGVDAGRKRVEMWRVEPDEFVEVVQEEYDPEEVELGETNYGIVTAMLPVEGGAPSTGLRYARGTGARAELPDEDGDGRPDWYDNCREAENFDMTDSDEDGFGNRCDADLDQDGLVTQDDIQRIRDCQGADLSLRLPFGEPDDPDDPESPDGAADYDPDPKEVRRAFGCRVADLDGDGIVDETDTGLADSMLDAPPGPSSFINRAPVADAGPDQEGACGEAQRLDGCDSSDPDGDELAYSWSSDSCSLSDPDDCATEAECEQGDNIAKLVVNDGTVDSEPDEVVVSVSDCEAVGVTPPTVRVRELASEELRLEWEEGCLPTETYGIYEGRGGEWDSHVALRCEDTDGDVLGETITPSADDRYYLVVPLNLAEGSYGTDSSGAERPRPNVVGDRCLPARSLDPCP